MVRALAEYTAVVVCGTGGMAAARHLGGRWPGVAQGIGVAWAVLFTIVHGAAANRLFVSVGVSGEAGVPMLYAATAAAAAGVAMFTVVALSVWWPQRGHALGFGVSGTAAIYAALGLASGAVLALVLSPQVRAHFAAIIASPDTLLAVCATAPSAVLEESVFRGRLIQVLSSRMESVPRVIVLQAVIFLGIHMPNRIGLAASDGWGVALRGIVRILSMGVIYGVMRFRTGSLWMGIGAHAVYNAMIVMAVAV